MKKLLTIILALSMVASMSACGNKKTTADDEKNNNTKIEEKIEKEEQKEKEEKTDDKKDVSEKKEEVKKENDKKTETKKEEVKKEENKKVEPTTSEKTDNKQNNTTTVTKPETKPEVKPDPKPTTPEVKVDVPASKPEVKPETKPETKPESKPTTSTTVGNTLLAAFKSKASTENDVVKIASALVTNPIIEFGGDAVEVEPGLLTGFRNNKITGFKKGAQFGPVIGTIPFVGYVFELEDGADTAAFISNLRSSANLRWNVCTEAEEMITGSSGNKVFFVMCRKSFDEEE